MYMYKMLSKNNLFVHVHFYIQVFTLKKLFLLSKPMCLFIKLLKYFYLRKMSKKIRNDRKHVMLRMSEINKN